MVTTQVHRGKRQRLALREYARSSFHFSLCLCAYLNVTRIDKVNLHGNILAR